jgi:hypothetical protein
MKITETVTRVWCVGGGGRGKAFSVVRVHSFGFNVSDLGLGLRGLGA